MSGAGQDLARTVTELRAAFDRSFAEALAAEPPKLVDLLAVTVAEHRYVLRLSEIVAVHAERPIVPVPSSTPELLGLVGVRGQVVPVYDLGTLLGHGAGAAPRWLAQVRAATSFALGFEQLEAHLRVPLDDVVVPPPDAPSTQPFARGTVVTPAGPRPLIDLAALVTRLTRREEDR